MSQVGQFLGATVGTGVLTLTGSSGGGAILPDGVGNITLTAGTGITCTGAGHAITIATTITGLTWSEETGATVALVADHGYVMNRATAITATLPASCAQFKTIKIVGKGVGLTVIAQNANQMIHYDTITTTTGIGGSLTATSQHGAIELLCTVADLEFTVISSTSNWTYV